MLERVLKTYKHQDFLLDSESLEEDGTGRMFSACDSVSSAAWAGCSVVSQGSFHCSWNQHPL